MYELGGKVALVTGAGGERGFGRAIANRLADEGADVAVNDIHDNPYGPGPEEWGGLNAVVREIEAKGRRSMSVVADVSSSADVDGMVSDVIRRLGKIDILVANAGSRPGADRVPVVDLTEEAFDEVQRVNVKGTFLCCRALARHMIERGEGGKIIIISSNAGKRGIARYAAYSASKFALVGFTQSLANEMGQYGVNVNAICPGLAATERAMYIADALRGEDETAEEQLAEMVRLRSAANPMGRVTETTDIARMAAFLSSSESDYLTGLAISVSGGDVMQ
jgi:NAD(P)-dependent dehydrogenase (short-subunit alcohol dehydrogenase family)